MTPLIYNKSSLTILARTQLSEIYHRTGGHPQIVQVICHKLSEGRARQSYNECLILAGGAHWHSVLGTSTYFSSRDFEPKQVREKLQNRE